MSLHSHCWNCLFKEKVLNLARSSSSQQGQKNQSYSESSTTSCGLCHWINTTCFSPTELSDCTWKALQEQQTCSRWLWFLEPLEVRGGKSSAKFEHMMRLGRAVQDTVLVLAGTELILFLVAGTVLCFGFSVRITLITLWCFSCC